MFHQTLDIYEILTFVVNLRHIFRSFLSNCVYLITMAAAFQVILDADEDADQQRLKPMGSRFTNYFLFI